MAIGVRIPDAADPAAFAADAERLGYDSLWAGELWGGDAFVRLAAAASRAETASFGTAVVNVFSRSPATLAMAAASLDRVVPGRTRLGLGASTPDAIEGLHGLAFERPVRRTHEAAALVSRLTGGDGRVSYEGQVFSVEDVPPLDADVAVYNAALGPANRRVTGRLCDGWIPHNLPFPELERAFEVVANAAREAGRDPADVAVAPYVPTAVCADPAEARSILRDHVAYYVGSGEGYERAVATRFPAAAEAIAEAWRAGERETARAAVTDEMLGALGAAGTPAAVRERVRDLTAAPLVDEPIVTIAGRPGPERIGTTLEALAPDGG